MKQFFSLQILCGNNEQLSGVAKILNRYKSKGSYNRLWILEKQQKRKYRDYISEFIKLLEGKYDALEKIGITRDMISIWYLYEYDQQCNMEFSPETMKKLADNGITLCISCWTNN